MRVVRKPPWSLELLGSHLLKLCTTWHTSANPIASASNTGSSEPLSPPFSERTPVLSRTPAPQQRPPPNEGPATASQPASQFLVPCNTVVSGLLSRVTLLIVLACEHRRAHATATVTGQVELCRSNEKWINDPHVFPKPCGHSSGVLVRVI